MSQPGVSAFGVLGAKPERQDEQENAKNERVRAEPPGQHQRADQRGDNQKDAIDKRRQSAQSEPPSPMVQLQAKRRRGHQPACDDRPCPQEQHEYDNRQARPQEGKHAGGDGGSFRPCRRGRELMVTRVVLEAGGQDANPPFSALMAAAPNGEGEAALTAVIDRASPLPN